MKRTVSRPMDEAQRVESLLQQMTLSEKVSLLSGRDVWRTGAIERLGIPSLIMTDGPHGVRAPSVEHGRLSGPATCFPTGASMGASWDPELVHRVGEALADETLALGCDILLGPCVNIIRGPLAGRNFEAYSEDPHLAGHIGAGWVEGLQSRGVGASLKHFACNNQEADRFRGDSVVDERTLREIYLAQFEHVVKHAAPWTVMCSYNRINGEHASQNAFLLTKVLREEWGFDGVVVSDWGANHTVTDSVAAGLDIEMPGPAKYYGRLLTEAVEHWQIDEAVVHEAARRVLRMVVRSGRMDTPRPTGKINTKQHAALARELAESSITLLKNDRGVLPLDPRTLRSLAVIGPNALEPRIGGGGSSYVTPPYRVGPLTALTDRLGKRVTVEFADGCDNTPHIPILSMAYVTTPDGSSPGLLGEFFPGDSLRGQPVARRTYLEGNLWGFAPPEGLDRNAFSLRLSGRLSVPVGRSYRLAVTHCHVVRVYLDGRKVIDSHTPVPAPEHPFHVPEAIVDLEAGRVYDLRIEFVKTPHHEINAMQIRLATAAREDESARIAAAADLAARCDAAVLFVGMPEGWETEGWDRPNMRMPGPQDALISAVAAANPRTVVVIHAGSPVPMPWIDDVPSVLWAFYPGQEAGNALANILLGDVSPSGRMPFTLPRRIEDTPSYGNFGAGRQVLYGEGVFVGYRHYDYRAIEPLFPFGHGLSYTTFRYGPLRAPRRVTAGKPIRASVTVTNTGSRTGSEVVQLYVRDVEASLPRPPKELKAFRKVSLDAGETATVEFELDDRALAFWDTASGQWRIEPGEFELLAGASAADIRSRKKLHVTGERR